MSPGPKGFEPEELQLSSFRNGIAYTNIENRIFSQIPGGWSAVCARGYVQGLVYLLPKRSGNPREVPDIFGFRQFLRGEFNILLLYIGIHKK